MTKRWKKWKKLSSADICRKEGFKAGTKLIGEEEFIDGPVTTVIKITAVGIKEVLAITLSCNGVKIFPEVIAENHWNLQYRRWRKVK